MRENDLKDALAWLLSWHNAQTDLKDSHWAGRGYAPREIADTIDALCQDRWKEQP